MNRLRQLIAQMNKTAPGAGLPAGATAMWKAENNANDEGGTYNATPGANTAYGTGYDSTNKAFQFNGNVNSRVVVPTINLAGAWSFDFWFKADAALAINTGYCLIGDKWTALSSAFGVIWANVGSSGLVSLNYSNNSTNRASTDSFLQRGNWYHVVYTYDGSKTRIYVNNQLFATESGTHSETYNQQVGLGAVMTAGTINPITGFIDEIICYPSVISVSLASNLIAWYKGDNSNVDSVNTWNLIDGSTPQYGTDAGSNANSCFSFDGTANATRNLPTLGPGNNWTVQFDMNGDSGQTGLRGTVYADGGAGSNNFGAIIWDATNGTVYYRHQSTNLATTANGSVPNSTWKTIKVTYDGSKIRIYINGTLAATESGTHSETWQTTNPSPVTLSNTNAAHTNGRFIGRIDNLKIYNAVV